MLAPGKRSLTEALPARTGTVAEQAAPGTPTEGAQAGTGDSSVPDRADDPFSMHLQAPGTGSALAGCVRDKFERSLGVDLGGVRVHSDAASAASAAGLSARAFAYGQDIYLGAGQPDMASRDGEVLLAHEVAHTVQQRGTETMPQAKLEISEEGDASEHEADRAAMAMVRGEPARVGSSTGLARKIMRWSAISGFTGSEYADTQVEASARFWVNGRDIWNDRAFGSSSSAAGRVDAGTVGTLQIHIRGRSGLGFGVLAPDRQWTVLTTWRGVQIAADGQVTIVGPGHVSQAGNAGEITISPSSTQAAGPAGAAFGQVQLALTRGSDPGHATSMTAGGFGTTVNPSARAAENGTSPAFRVSFDVAHARAPEPTPTSTPTPTPTPAPTRERRETLRPPEMRPFLFAAEGQTENPPGELVQWISTWDREVVAAINSGRLQVICTGYASTTGAEGSNFLQYARGRAQWAQQTVMIATGASSEHVRDRSLGAFTGAAGRADPHDRRVEISIHSNHHDSVVAAPAP
jgi:Domain of unknown function (DUF4157)